MSTQETDYNALFSDKPRVKDPFKGDFRVTSSLNLDPLLTEARKLRAEAKDKDVTMKHTIPQSPAPEMEDRKRKVVEESRKMIETFREKISNYPKHLSYEGSMVICVMLSMQSEVWVPLISLPQIDQQLIRDLAPDAYKNLTYVSVRFDKEKDFAVKIIPSNKNESPYEFTLFNTVAHPRPEDLKDVGNGVVPVEEKEGTINVGGNALVLDKKRLANLAQLPSKEEIRSRSESQDQPSILKTTNRNAYEIRADVLQMAIDWAKHDSEDGERRSDEELLSLAKKFYRFVENR